MTEHEFKKIQIFAKENELKTNYVLIFPEGIKCLKKPSDYQLKQSDEGKDISISCSSNTTIDGDNFILREHFYENSKWNTKKVVIPYKYIKKIFIYKYNAR